MSFLRSPARRSVLRVTGVVVAVCLATAAPVGVCLRRGSGPLTTRAVHARRPVPAGMPAAGMG